MSHNNKIQSILKLSIHPRLALVLMCLTLTCVTVFVYRDIINHDFLTYDDKLYVVENHQIQKGFTLDSLRWAFSSAGDENKPYWHPLTWLSHIIDYQFFGLNAGRHLMVNLAIHVTCATMLILIFYHMTGALWKSVFVGALFALHPLNVESVAWIASRKNTLSTLFWMLTLIAWVYYTTRPNVRRYLLVLILFVMGLLSKLMIVTLPAILLLLDYWPMGRVTATPGLQANNLSIFQRLTRTNLIRLILEKIPLLGAAFIMFLMVLFSLLNMKRIIETELIPLGLRGSNAIVSPLKYAFKTFWPHPLAVYYPFPDEIPLWHVIGAGSILSIITIMSLVKIKRAPWMFVGWFWFLISLSPVAGMIQGGLWPEMADRWAYVPAIGLFVIIAWGWDAISLKIPNRRAISALLATVILVSFSFLTQKQVSYWQNTRTLFEHALAVTPENQISLFNYGIGLSEQGLTDQAIEQYYKALKLQPDYGDVHTNLGKAFYEKGMYDKSIHHYELAARLKPDSPKTQSDLANAYAATGLFEKTLTHYAKALDIEPNDPLIHYNMGVAHYKLHHYDEAAYHFQAAIRIKPDYISAINALKMIQQIKR
jgi:protein O-mannosyl-transferase